MTLIQSRISYFIMILSFTFYTTPVQAEDIIQGNYCYTYGDKESLLEAKQLTRTLAIRNAIESYRIFINSTTKVNNFVLTNDIVQMISSGYMTNIKTISQSVEGRTVCEKIQATVSAKAIEAAIKKEVLKRSEKIEEEGIDNNGFIKILNIKEVGYRGGLDKPKYNVIQVTTKALQTFSIDGYFRKLKIVFIDYYDKNGNAIGGDRIFINGLFFINEIRTVNFEHIPNGTHHYKVWLQKPSEVTQPESE